MSRPTVHGWPFLVGRGRRRGYSTLLAPDFLVTQQTYGFLEEIIDPSSAGEAARAIQVILPSGLRLTVVHAVHRVTAADLGDDAPDPVDEHSRPLRVMYGFVCPDLWVLLREDPEAAEADLRTARTAALDLYRRFLAAAEDTVTVQPSAGYPLRSRLAGNAPASVVVDRSGPPRPPDAPSGVAGRDPARARTVGSAIALAVTGLVLLVLLVLVVMWLRPDERECPPPDPKATTTIDPNSTGGAEQPSGLSCPPAQVNR